MIYILTHWDDGDSEHGLDKASFCKKYQSGYELVRSHKVTTYEVEENTVHALKHKQGQE